MEITNRYFSIIKNKLSYLLRIKYKFDNIFKKILNITDSVIYKNRGGFMLAVKGIYNNGEITIKEKLSIQNTTSEVIIIFPDEVNYVPNELSPKNRRKLFEEFSGSINRNIDIKEEKTESLENKYENTN